MFIGTFESVIEAAIENNRLRKVVFLLKAAEFIHLNLNQDFLGRSMIKCASSKPVPEKFQAITVLLDLGARPNFTNWRLRCRTPLEAAIRSLDLAAVELLVRAGADPVIHLPLAVNHEVIDWKKQHLVTDDPKKIAILEFLLSACDLVNISKSFFAENKSLATAIYEAIENGEHMIGETCLRHGFKIDTPLSIQAQSGLETSYLFRSKETARWYFDHGARSCSCYNPMTAWLDEKSSE